MYYCLGTVQDCEKMEGEIPMRVYGEIVRGLAILDSDYGANRDYFQVGGYSLFADTEEDLELARKIFDDRKHCCEWATTIGDTGYCSCLYLTNNEFSIMLYIPIALANLDILENLEP